MSVIVNFFTALGVRLALFLGGFAALFGLTAVFFGALFGKGRTLKDRLGAAYAKVETQRQVFALLRAFQPNLVLKKQLVTAYANTGTVIVTRFSDVQEVLARDEDFEVVYAPRMAMITDGDNFFLGMQNTPRYTRDVTNMRLAVRREDVAGIVQPFVTQHAASIVEGLEGDDGKGRIDVPQALTLVVPTQLLGAYFGTPGPDQASMIDWTTTLFWYLFIDLDANPVFDAKAQQAAKDARAYLDVAVAARKARPVESDDVLNRCLAMQTAGVPGMDDVGIRNYLVGLLIGLVPTTSKAAVQALDQLLNRPEALAAAQAAARDDDDQALAASIFEALRFNPVNPLIYRRAVAETWVAANTLRARKIPKGALVMACNLSAMFDPLRVGSPDTFRAGRPWEDYMLWGAGLHTCFGAWINRAMIPAILKALLKKPGLRRAAGVDGVVDTGGTPFPVRWTLEWG